MDMIPVSDALDILGRLSSIRNKPYKNVYTFEADVEYKGEIMVIRVVSMNCKNSKKKLERKLSVMKQILTSIKDA